MLKIVKRIEEIDRSSMETEIEKKFKKVNKIMEESKSEIDTLLSEVEEDKKNWPKYVSEDGEVKGDIRCMVSNRDLIISYIKGAKIVQKLTNPVQALYELEKLGISAKDEVRSATRNKRYAYDKKDLLEAGEQIKSVQERLGMIVGATEADKKLVADKINEVRLKGITYGKEAKEAAQEAQQAVEELERKMSAQATEMPNGQ